MASVHGAAYTPLKTHILREAQDGPYLVAPEHLREQLLQAKSRLQPLPPNRVISLHITWDDPHSRKYLYPGCFRLAATFEEYGYTTQQVPLSCHWSPVEHQAVPKMMTQPFVGYDNSWDRFSMIIIHYRGKTEYRDADETYNRPHVLLRPSTEGYEGQVNFTELYETLQSECRAQVVYLMDCDFPFRPLTDSGSSWRRDIPQFGCDPILAATSGGSDYDTSSCRQCFNNALIRHLKNALRDERYHSLSTLYCVTHQIKHKSVASRGFFGGKLRWSFHQRSPCFTPTSWGESDLALVPMVQPTQSLGTVLVKVRVSRMKRAADGSVPSSQLAADLQQWFAEDFQWSACDASSTEKLAEVVDSGGNDGFVQLKLSRALWHCFMPYRGWIEMTDGVDQPEGILPYYGKWPGDYPGCFTRPITPRESPELTPGSGSDSDMEIGYSLFD